MDMRSVARWVVWGCLFIIPFTVLYVSNGLFFPFISGKGFAFRILVEIAFAAWAILALADEKYRPKFSWTLALYGIFTVWMFIADALGESPFKAFWSNYERMDGWVTLVHVFLFFVVLGSVLSVDSLWRKWWLTFLGASFLVSLYGIAQLLCTGNACGAAGMPFAIHQGTARLDATLGNASYLASYLLFTVAVAFWQGLESKKGWLRYSLFALAALEIIVIYFTATRGAVLGLIGAAFVAMLLWAFQSGSKGRRYAVGALVALVLVTGAVYLARESSFVRNEPTLSRVTSISLGDLQTRFTIWHMALQGFAARPITGWGQEGFSYVFNTYYDPSMYAQEPWFDRAHNTFFDWLLAGGLPALLLFLGLFVSAVIGVYRRETSKGERIMLVAAFVAYAIQALVVFDNLFSYVPLAALFALAHSASARPLPSLKKIPVISGSVSAPIAVVALVVICWFVNVPNIAVAHELLLALSPQTDLNTNLDYFKAAVAEHSFAHQEISEQLVTFAANIAGSSAVPADTKSSVISYALEQIGQEVQNRPKDARILLEQSLAYRAAGDLQDALKSTQAALMLSPNKQQILIEEGTTLWQLGDMKGANDAYQKSYQLAPAYDDGATYAAAGDLITGDVKAAGELLVGHFGTTTVDNDLLLYALYQAKVYAPLVSILELRDRTAESVDTGFRLASAYALVGRYSDARAIITSTVQKHPEAAATGQQLLAQLAGR